MKPIEYDEILSRIDSLDLEPIKFKFVSEHGYSDDQIQLLEKWYKRFLFLAFKYKDQQIVLAEILDNFWHQHILDTRKYAEDCETAFGEFLHHFPYFGLRGDDDRRALRTAYQSTLNLMRDEYGETPEEDLKVFATTFAFAADSPSSCSDCSGIWPGTNPTFSQARPRQARV